jgi:hypothetical protein
MAFFQDWGYSTPDTSPVGLPLKVVVFDILYVEDLSRSILHIHITYTPYAFDLFLFLFLFICFLLSLSILFFKNTKKINHISLFILGVY